MTKLWTALMVVGVSLASAQDVQHAWTAPETNSREDTASAGVRYEAPDSELTVAARNGAGDTGSVFFKFSDERKPKRSGSRSFATSVREEMNSLALTLPDLSVSWLGLSCYIRNPLRYKLSPGSTYAHQMGFSTGDWFLSVDGIKPNTLRDVDIALQYPVNERMRLFFRYSDMQYKLNIHAFGKLPWEE